MIGFFFPGWSDSRKIREYQYDGTHLAEIAKKCDFSHLLGGNQTFQNLQDDFPEFTKLANSGRFWQILENINVREFWKAKNFGKFWKT